MNLIRLAIDRPIAVVAAILMVVMFGLVALQTIPIQLTPDVRKPVLTVETFWPARRQPRSSARSSRSRRRCSKASKG